MKYISLIIFILISLPGSRVAIADDASIYISKSLRACKQDANFDIDHLAELVINTSQDPCSLTRLTVNDLRLLRNSIYANHGREFESEDLKDYFAKKKWYHINKSYNDNLLTETQRNNVKLILAIETLKKIASQNVLEHNLSEKSNPNFPPLKDFLDPISDKPSGHTDLNFKANIVTFNRSGKKVDLGPQYETMPDSSGIVYLPKKLYVLGDSILINTYFRVSSIEPLSCYVDIYDLSGNEIEFQNIGLPFRPACPEYIYRYNKDLLVGKSFFINKKHRTNTNTSYIGLGGEVTRLLTFIPSTKSIIAGMFQNENEYVMVHVWIFDKEGQLLVHGFIGKLVPKDHANDDKFNYSLNNFTGVSEILEGKVWILRFSNMNGDEFIMLSSSVNGAKDEYKKVTQSGDIKPLLELLEKH